MILGSEVHIDIFDDRMEIYSPGGMMDGSFVQNLNTDNISSKRRNPVIADVFSRMNYMERRGSGFKKIKEDYHCAVNYRPELEPKFYSDISSFIVTLYNLNYNVPVEKIAIDPEKVAIGVAIDVAIEQLNASQGTIGKALAVYAQMGSDKAFGRSDVASITHESATAAGNLINKLKNAGLIEAVSGFGKGKYRFISPQ
jgi:ATP-dependent DNA helicase RecG